MSRRNLITLLTAALASSGAFAQAPATAVEIDLQEQTAYLIRDGRAVLSSPICSGRDGHLTETGSFKVLEKERSHVSTLYGTIVDGRGNIVVAEADGDMSVPPGCRFVQSPMRYFVRFNNATGMHAGYLPGYPASHGCVRLPEARAIAIFNAVDVGTPVTVFGRTPHSRRFSPDEGLRAPRWSASPNDPRLVDPRTWWLR